MRTIRTMLALSVLGLAALSGGFLWFLWRVPTQEIALDRSADGIVVLTGGASRISDAVELLASGRGQRLLITGVHPTTNSAEISRATHRNARVFTCCVDLDRVARNTLGNAVETRRWVKERGFRSLIVVTSNYHMPRAMAELGRQLPDVTLIPFPVVTEHLRADRWWASPGTARLLFSEYLKYVLALVRAQADPPLANATMVKSSLAAPSR